MWLSDCEKRLVLFLNPRRRGAAQLITNPTAEPRPSCPCFVSLPFLVYTYACFIFAVSNERSYPTPRRNVISPHTPFLPFLVNRLNLDFRHYQMVLLLTNIMSPNNQRLLFFCMGSAFTFMALVTLRLENLIIPDQFYQAEIQHLEQSFFNGGSSGSRGSHSTAQHHQQQQQMIISQAKAELARQTKEFRQKHGATANNVNINNIDTAAYQDPLPLNLTKSQRRSLPLPVQIMERYRKQHSVESLRQDSNPHKRKFAIGFYVCPLSAGTRANEK